MMRSKIFTLMLVCGVCGFSRIEAGQWNFKIEPIWMSVYGNDLHIGDVCKYTYTFREDEQGGWNIGYGFEYQPIILAMKNGLAPRLELNYQVNQWGFNLSAWSFRSNVRDNGFVFSPPAVYIGDTYIAYIYCIRMWNHTIVPVYNELEPSGFSPVSWWGSNKLGVYTADIDLTNSFFKKNEDQIDLTLGLKFGKIFHERSEKQTQHAYTTYTAPFWVIFDNQISLESRSKINYQVLRGPSLGIRIEKKLGDIKFDGFLKQSFLFGQVQSSGVWIDIDDIDWLDYHTGELIYHDHYEGKFPFSKTEKIALPVTEFKLSFSFSVSKNIDLGFVGFGSVWYNAPMAPQWSVPGEWTSISGTGWKEQKSTLFFSGTGLSLNFKF